MNKVKFYITFGQIHAHSVNGKTFDKDCVCVIRGNTAEECDKKAFEVFKGIFHEHSTRMPPMEYYPRGFIELE